MLGHHEVSPLMLSDLPCGCCLNPPVQHLATFAFRPVYSTARDGWCRTLFIISCSLSPALGRGKKLPGSCPKQGPCQVAQPLLKRHSGGCHSACTGVHGSALSTHRRKFAMSCTACRA